MNTTTIRFLCSAACLAVLAAGCSSEVTDKPAQPAAAAGKKVDAATAGSIAGQVKFEGTVPPADVIRMGGDRKCVPDAGPNPQSDALLVSADKGVKNAFVVRQGRARSGVHL
jgi:hypothetical protein